VVIVAVKRIEGDEDSYLIAVAPITHSAPEQRPAVELPRLVKARLRLDELPSWVMCDEMNQFEWPGFDLDRTPDGQRTFGRIPDPLLQTIRLRLLSGAPKIAKRD
jgi:hypothetical protein